MSEGQSFEKHEIPPQPEIGPEVDFESVLEKGEIVSKETLEGHAPIMVIKIKDDGTALFKPDDVEYSTTFKDKGTLRAALEIAAFKVDQILGFNLVPLSVGREIIGLKGVLQKFINDAVLAAKLDYWERYVDQAEIKKAAVFDYLMGSEDRKKANFLVNPEGRKIWLIDHDYYMFIVRGGRTVIVDMARTLSDQGFSEEILAAIVKLNGEIGTLVSQAQDSEVKSWLESIKPRADKLLVERRIPSRA